MDKKIIFILLATAVILISGCTTTNSGNETKKVINDSLGDEHEDTPNKAINPTTVATASNQNLDPTKRCGPGQAIQGFDLTDSSNPDCISVNSEINSNTGTSDTTSGNGDSNPVVISNSEAHHDHWTFRADGDANTDSTIESESVVDIRAGDGISLLKEGNILTIAAIASAIVAADSNGSSSTGTWTLGTPFAKLGQIITMGDGARLNIKGSGATSVSINSANKEVTISSPITEWGVFGGFFGPDFTIKNGENLKITGSGGTTVTTNNANKEVVITSPVAQNVKQYQYRTSGAWCQDSGNNNFWVVEDEDTGIDVSCTNMAGRGELTARCTTGKIINYGGRCQSSGSDRNAIQWIGPTGDFSSGDGYTRTWSDLPTISEITLLCKEDLTVLMHAWVTCVREKP